MKLDSSGQVFKKYSNIRFHKSPSIGNQAVPCGQTDGRTNMKKLIVAFRKFAIASKDASLRLTHCSTGMDIETS